MTHHIQEDFLVSSDLQSLIVQRGRWQQMIERIEKEFKKSADALGCKTEDEHAILLQKLNGKKQTYQDELKLTE